MRILSLRMEAFGPFAERCFIDFERAHTEGLFLIQGPTGAGKTSILDALCFALYGASSGSERLAASLRSHHVSPETATIVELDFEISGKKYRIRRQMAGRKSSATQEKVQLEDRGRTSGLELSGTIIADKRSEVQEEINRLLHLNETQFRQVIVLPQGKFRELLVAKSQIREEILKSLFDTARLEDIVDRVLGRRREQEELCQKLRQEMLFIRENLSLENPENMGQLVEERARILENLEAELETARNHSAQLRSIWENGRKLLALHGEADENRNVLAALEQTRPDTQREQLKNAQSARSLQPVRDSLEQNESAQNRMEKELRQLELEIAQQSAMHSEASQKFERATIERENLSLHRDRLAQRRALLPQLAGLQKQKDEVRSLESKKHTAEENLRTILQGLAVLNSQFQAKREEREGHNAWALQLPLVEKLKRTIDELARNKDRYTKCGQEKSAIEDAIRRIEQECSQVGADIATVETQLEQALSHEKQHEASLLARELRDGDPCPVCGSLHHPQPAPVALSETPAPEIEKIQSDLQKRHEFFRNRQVQLQLNIENRTRIEQELTALTAESNALEEQLRQAVSPAEPPEDSNCPTEILAFIKDLGASVLSLPVILHAQDKIANLTQQAQTSLSTRSQLDRQCSALDVSRNNAQDTRHHEESALAVLSEKLDHQNRQLEETETRLVETLGGDRASLPSEAELALILEAEAARIVRIDQEWEHAGKTANEVELALAVGRTRHDELQRLKQHTQDEAVKLRNQWIDQIQKLGFADEKAALSAFLDETRAAELENEISRWDRSYLVAQERLKSLSSQIGSSPVPDIADMERELQFSEETTLSLERQRTLEEQQLVRLRAGAAQINSLAEKYSAASARLDSLSALCKLLQGTDADGSYVNLQRYALSVYLDEILEHANQHLADMSRGRYQLIRQDAVEGRRKGGGLELQIVDSYTGSQRGTESLSGGESFLAALSLALGLSSVVHQRSGGLRLDTLFVDEGFGSLDEEALQDAMNVLGRLHEKGRTVGIISHVRELQERIQVQLAVTRSQGGSSAAWRT